ncbi:unnamed protein product, partial [Laminaria digitata]
MLADDHSIRGAYAEVAQWLSELPDGQLALKTEEAELLFRRMGITFLVY